MGYEKMIKKELIEHLNDRDEEITASLKKEMGEI